MSRINVKDVAIGHSIHIFNPTYKDRMITSLYVESVRKINAKEWVFNDDYFHEEYAGEIYSNLDEAIDRLRSINLIFEFDTTTIYKYMPYIVNAITRFKEVHVIRERNQKDRYLDTLIISEIKYNSKVNKWRLKLISKTGKSSTFDANKLGVRIYFDRDNAIAKLKKLKKVDSNEV